MAKKSARIADELRASDIVILDVRKLSDATDFFVICTGDNRRQLRALRGRLLAEFTSPGAPPIRVEGEPDSPWILLDLLDVVVHLFDPDARRFYDLELLWGDAPRVEWRPRAGARRREGT